MSSPSIRSRQPAIPIESNHPDALPIILQYLSDTYPNDVGLSNALAVLRSALNARIITPAIASGIRVYLYPFYVVPHGGPIFDPSNYPDYPSFLPTLAYLAGRLGVRYDERDHDGNRTHAIPFGSPTATS